MDLKILQSIFVIVLSLILFSNVVLAIPGLPNAFKGYVTINGQPASDGTTIVAKINGVQVASTTTSGGKYGYPSGSFYIDDPNNDRSGDVINFFVNGVDTGQFSYFCNGCVTMLNLTATVPTGGQQQGGTTGGSTGGGGGAIGGQTTTNITTNETTPQQTCQERWICGDWAACIDSIQRRVCTDSNNCGTEENRPLEVQPCSAKQIEIPTAEAQSPLTGLLAALSNPAYSLLIVLIVAAILLTVFRKKIITSKK